MAETQGYAKVKDANGRERVVMWDGVDYTLEAGKEVIFPAHIAAHFSKNFNIPNAEGVPQRNIIVTPVTEDNLLVRGLEVKEVLLPCAFPGCTFECHTKEELQQHFMDAHLNPQGAGGGDGPNPGDDPNTTQK